MKPPQIKILLTLTLLALSIPLASAALLESFEALPFVAPGTVASNPPYASVTRSSAAGVTDGTYSMRLDLTNGPFLWLYMAQPSKFDSFYPAYGQWYSHRKVKIDVFRPAQTNGWNFNLAMAINNQGTWQQTNLQPAYLWLNPGESLTQTLTWDYGYIRDTNLFGGYWLQLVLAANVATNTGPTLDGTAYVDNVRFTDAVDMPFTFPPNNNGGELYGWVPQGWGTAQDAVYWDATDANTDASSGSMYCWCYFDNATTLQTAVFQGWNLGLETTAYAKLLFDIKVDGTNSLLTTAGDYGNLQVVFRGTLPPSTFTYEPLGTFNIPASATNAFVHYEVPLYQPIATNGLAGMNLIFGGTNFQGPVYYYVDNIKFLTETNPPTLTLDKALPGLELSAAGSTADQRQSVRTRTGNYNWTTAGGPVTYSMTISEGLPAQATNMMAYIFLVGTTNSNPAAIGDYNEENGIFLEIRQQASGLCNAALLYKTNAAAGNGIRYTPGGVLATVQNVPMTGAWSLTLNGANFGLTTPGGGSTNSSLPAAAVSQFSSNVFAYFGVQPNSTAHLGRYIDVSRVQISGVASPLDQVFTGQSTLNTNVLVASAANVAGVQVRPSNVVYRLSWPAPPSNLYDLQSASDLTGTWASPGLPLIVGGSRNITFLPATSLPSAGAGFFRLLKQP